MKIKTLTHGGYQPGTSEVKRPRNLDPALHPFAKAREYTRGLTAVKLERMFAAPFLGQLGGGHTDGVYSLALDPESLERCGSGSGDGIVKVWDLPSRSQVWSSSAHDHIVSSLSWTKQDTRKLLSCSADKTVKLWDPYNTEANSEPIATWLGEHGFSSISHHGTRNAFAVSSTVISIYDLENTTAAPEVLAWPNDDDTINCVRFNPSETSVLAACSTERSVILGDLRTGLLSRKFVLPSTINALCWNPMETFNLAIASEDHNIYIFDSRRFDKALNILKDHVAPVTDVSYSPTGLELVSASWDRTIRLWSQDRGHSRDIYHTKRQQRVMAAQFTQDAKFILSGSDDGNIRLWRAKASDREGIKSSRQQQALAYNRKLVDKYEHMPEIRRIRRHRHLPGVVKKASEIKRQELDAIKRREENELRHSKKKFMRQKTEREKAVLRPEV